MIRLLIVLAVVVLAAFLLNYGTDREGKATSPEQTYEQRTGEARALEQQLQQQAQDQLEAIDAATQAPPSRD